MKKYFISNLNFGETYTLDLAVIRKQTRTAKNNRSYLVLDLADKTGQVNARMWEEIPKELEWTDLQVNKVYQVEGKLEEYQGKKQFIITHIERVSNYDNKDFLPTIKEDPEELWQELRSIQNQIENPWLKKLVEYFFTDEKFVKRFKEAPAAKSIHDSALGGLLRHTLRMTKLALESISIYSEMNIDKDFVVAGISFHDMEKINEYSFDGVSIEYTDTGHFVGHAVMSCNSLSKAIEKINDFPKEIEDHIIHIVAAHAGEYDPIRLPSTLEANLVHLVDYLDSRLVHIQQEKEKAEEGTVWKKDYYSNSWLYLKGSSN